MEASIVQASTLTCTTNTPSHEATDLVLALEASKTYLVRFTGTIFGALIHLAIPSGATVTGRWVLKPNPTNTGVRTHQDIVANTNQTITATTAATEIEMWAIVTVAGTPGDVMIKVANTAGGAVVDVLQANSVLSVREVDGTTVDCTTGDESTPGADHTVPANTTLALAVGSSKTYLVRVYWRGVANGTNIRFAFTGPAGASITGWNFGFASSATQEANRFEITALGSVTTNTSSNSTNIGAGHIWVKVTTAGTAGTVTLQIASSTAGTGVTLKAGACMTCDEITGSGGGTTPAYDTLSSQFSTTAATAQDTGLELNIDANATVIVRAYLTVDAPAGGMKFALDCPAGATVEGWVISSQASLITTITERFTAIDTLTASMAATVRGTAEIFAVVVNGANAGSVKVQACSTTATQTTIVDAGSTLEMVPLADDILADLDITFGAMTGEGTIEVSTVGDASFTFGVMTGEGTIEVSTDAEASFSFGAMVASATAETAEAGTERLWYVTARFKQNRS